MKKPVGRPRKLDRVAYVSLAATLDNSRRLHVLADELQLKSANATIEFLLNFYEVMK